MIAKETFMEWFWLSLTIGLLVTELATTRLVAIWFSIGAGVTAILSFAIKGLPIYAELLIFVPSSLLLLIVGRITVKRLIKRYKENKKI